MLALDIYLTPFFEGFSPESLWASVLYQEQSKDDPSYTNSIRRDIGLITAY
jgi:hypothetical protein